MATTEIAANGLLSFSFSSAVVVTTIIHAAKNVLEQTPPELAADIIDKGIVITGGGALIHGFEELLSHELKVPVFIAETPVNIENGLCNF